MSPTEIQEYLSDHYVSHCPIPIEPIVLIKSMNHKKQNTAFLWRFIEKLKPGRRGSKSKKLKFRQFNERNNEK